MRIIVLGYIVRGPLGGLVWHHLQYVMGLHRLGHDVYFIEDSDDFESCYDPLLDSMTSDPSFGLRFAANVFSWAGLGERWAYFDAHVNQWLGPAGAGARKLLRSADLVLNLSAINPVREWNLHAPHRALIDTDPVFTQVRHRTKPRAMEQALTHTAFFTFGENMGHEGCSIPDDGLPWLPTRQPICLDAWPVQSGCPNSNFSTVMQWDSYPAVEDEGRRFDMKSASFSPYLDLPLRVQERLELAVGSASAPRDCLRDHGWLVTDPLTVTRDPFTYQQFIQQSKAEFTVAKQGYVISSSGWFSERSAAYLASGRPVVTENTAFTDWLPSGAGMLAFHNPDEALAGIEEVNRRYEYHCRQARSIAVEYFDSAKVLTNLVERATTTTKNQQERAL